MSGLLDNLPALVVVFPLLAGLLVMVLGKQGRAWWLTCGAVWILFAACLWLGGLVLNAPEGFISYHFGGWTPRAVPGAEGAVAIGIEYRVDQLNAFILVLVSGVAAIVTPFARLSVARDIPADRLHVFYAVYLLCITGLLGIAITGDAFNLYVLLEISSLTTYILVAMGKQRDRRALTASYRYLILGTVGASFLLVGIGYLFMVTGTLNMAEMAQQLALLREQGPNRTVTTAFGLIVVGLGLKMALFPLHAWLPNAYTYAPAAVTALLASTATKVGIYVAFRFFFTIFGAEYSFGSATTDAMLLFACLAILHGSLMAIQQTDVKRLLAYSSVAQIGYMALGICIGNQQALTGGLLHMLNHALVKGALFIAVGAILYRTGSTHLDALKGLGRRMPLTSAAIVVAGLGLVGLPLTGGFISKWHLVSGALARGQWPVAVVVLFGSVLAVVYVMRIVEPLFFARTDEAPDVSEAPPSLVLPAWILALGSIYLGVYGKGLATDLIAAAAQSLAAGVGS